AAVAEGTVDAALVEGREVVYQELPSPELETLLGDAHQHAFTVYSLGELGIDPAEALEFLSVPPLEQRWLDEAADRAHERLMVAVVGVLLLYVLVLVLGQSISQGVVEDRKSTRLNSSHVSISYAVFCLKKKSDRRQHRL